MVIIGELIFVDYDYESSYNDVGSDRAKNTSTAICGAVSKYVTSTAICDAVSKYVASI